MNRLRRKPQIDVFPSYKGGHTAFSEGYIYEFAPEHHRCNRWGFVAQHRLVMEDILGAPIPQGQIVHHKDENPLNNDPSNLQLMSKSEHRRHHNQKRRAEKESALTEEVVRKALRGRTTKEAASLLGVHHQTLRNRFDHLLRKRKSPTRIDDTKVVELIRPLAADPMIGLREAVAQTGVSAMTILRICDRHGIVWVGKTRKGEKRRPYRKQQQPSKLKGKPRPPRVSDPEILAMIRILAPDPGYSLEDVGQLAGISAATVAKVCEREGILWVRQCRRHEKRKPYQRRKPTPLQLEACGPETAPDGQ